MSSTKFLKDITLIGLISVILFLVIDFIFGSFLLFNPKKLEKKYRIKDSIFHHTLISNYDGLSSWDGINFYRICTNNFGFKDTCDKSKQIKSPDIVFIGDSFTEGVGLVYEDTFVGQIASARPYLKIANMGVSSYSPSIYLAKVNEFLNRGLIFKELIVYIDISDIQDEANSYIYENGVVKDITVPGENNYLKLSKEWFDWAFPLTYKALSLLKYKIYGSEINYEEDFRHKNFSRGGWTYNSKVNNYGNLGVEGSIDKSLKIMDQLYTLLEGKGISLSIGVYPWPSQLLYDDENSIQVKIWQDFCRTRCKNFYNSFPTFFEQKKKHGDQKVLLDFFQNGDVHHNRSGAKLISDDFLKMHVD